MKTLALLCALLILSQSITFSGEITNPDPIPWAHDGLGCMTDSECEGIAQPDNEF